jgi:hypothetical protein
MRNSVLTTVLSMGLTIGVNRAAAAPATPEPQVEAASRKAQPATCDGSAGTTCLEPWTRKITIGPGLTAGSFRFDGKIGLLDSVVPIEVGYNGFQRTYVAAGQGGATRIILWRVARGLTFTKPAGDEGISFGAYLMPWGIQIENFAAGLGLSYRAVDKLESNFKNWAVVIPFSYTVQLGS